MISAFALPQQRDRGAPLFPFRRDDSAKPVHSGFVKTGRFGAYKLRQQSHHRPLTRPKPIEQRTHCGTAPHCAAMLAMRHYKGNRSRWTLRLAARARNTAPQKPFVAIGGWKGQFPTIPFVRWYAGRQGKLFSV